MSSPVKKRKTTATTTNKKKKKPNPTPQSTPIPSLPDDLLLNCLARVSRLYYPTLSLVSKSFRSLIASPEIYKARSLLGHTESCLYVCIRSIPGYRWYTLCRKPDQTLTNGTKSTGYVLARLPIPHSPPADLMGLVAVGSSIYNIPHSRSSSVTVLDCRSHKWREAPRFRVELLSRSASVVDQKIYVAGCYDDGDSLTSLFEVFDTKTQIWDPLPPPCTPENDACYYQTACIDGKFHVTIERDVAAYNSKEGTWDLNRSAIRHYMYPDSYCEIDNVLYSAMEGEFRWYDTEVKKWRNLKGLVGLPKLLPASLADYGGKMVVFWNRYLPYNKKIWCAEIALEKRPKNREIWGKVEWFDHVLTDLKVHSIVKVLTATV